MIDSGAFTSLIPPTQALQATNGTPIFCYGVTDMTISLGGREFHHRLTIAGVNFSMLGSDFLASNFLAPNARDQNLIDVHKMDFINVKLNKRTTYPGINFVGIKPVEQANSLYYRE